MEQQEFEQEFYLMPHHQEVNSPASPHQEEEKVPSEQGDNPMGEMHNISFDASQHRVVLSQIVDFGCSRISWEV